jgi:hypothetical protein
MLAGGSVATAAESTTKAGMPGSPESLVRPGREASKAPTIDNWAAPQHLNLPDGVTASPSMQLSGGIAPKTQWTLTSLVPVNPCRLVDTRGVFSPVYAGGAFAANEVRNYVIPPNCAVPAGTNHIKAVSLQFTTPPTAASGDIEVIATGATLGGTVAMVIQAGQWNSVSITPAVNSAGSIQVQLRGTPGHVVIDLNGYYANLNTAQDDVFAIQGTHSGGGVLFVTNSNPGGAAINAVNGGNSQVELAYGTDAIDVVSGNMRVRGAGVGTGTIAFRHQVGPGGTFAAGTGTLCSAGSNDHVSMISHPQLNGNPNAIAIITPREQQSTGNFFPTGFPGVVLFYDDTGLCTGTGTNKWGVLRLDFNAWTVAQQYNVWVVSP